MKKGISRVFFDSNPITTKKEENINQKIISLLNKYDCNVVQTVMGVELSYLEIQGKNAAGNIFNTKIKDIVNNDIFVCEVSNITPTLVFEIFEALNQKKPVLALFSEQNATPPDIAFLGHPSNLLHFEPYNDQNLEAKIEEFLKKTRKQIPISRFTIRLTKELGEYLDFLKAKMHSSSKNEVILTILSKMMAEDSGFQG